MNHQTAKIIAESYRAEADTLLRFGVSDSFILSRWNDMLAHAAVWQRVADTLALEAPHVPQ